MTPPATSRRAYAGFWSSAKSFSLPVGAFIDPDAVRGYPIDMRVKADAPRGVPAEMLGPAWLHVALTQYALGCHEHWLAGEGDAWLDSAVQTGRHLLRVQSADGAWLHHQPFPHTFTLVPPWTSGITQGQGASLFVRLYAQTGEEAFADAARRALLSLHKPQAQGGVQGDLGGLPWPEEYPTTPQSHVLNGAIFALWGMRDVAVGLDDAQAREQFAQGLDSLAINLLRYDTGNWSLYSLYPHPILNRASSFYHDLHVNQLTAMAAFAPRPEFDTMRRRWAAYAASRPRQAMAFAWKAAFRLLVPRNRAFARLAPWTRA